MENIPRAVPNGILRASKVSYGGLTEVIKGTAADWGPVQPWGTLSPRPPGIYRFFSCSSRGVKKNRANLRRSPPGLCCLQGSSRRSSSIPGELSSAGAKGVFPVSVSLGVYRAGKGKREIELVAFGVATEFSLLGQLFQGRAERFSANSAEFAQLLHGEHRFLELGQGGADALDGTGFGFGLGEGFFQHRQSQGRTGLSELEWDMVLGGSGPMFGGQG